MRTCGCILAALLVGFVGCGDHSGGGNNQNNPRCGNGVLDRGEECDEGDGNSDTEADVCRTDCRLARCGDGAADSAESCDGQDLKMTLCTDRGYTHGTLACTSACEFDVSACHICGNGTIELDERCDSSNFANQNCATEAGMPNGSLLCTSDCEVDSSGCHNCGNSTLEGPEACDDGNNIDGDGCSSDCLSDESCGNGHVDSVLGEACDDGNTQDGDGCTRTCAVESGWYCVSSPSACVPWGGPVAVAAGTFLMGSPTTEEGRGEDETRHQVTFTNDFEIFDREASQAAFLLFMGYNPSYFSSCGPDCPVEQVSWHEAAAFCNALSDEAALQRCYICAGTPPAVTCAFNTAFATPYDCPGWRLPTESEWEYAARALTVTATYNGELDANHLVCEQPNPVLDPIAWFCGNSGSTTHPVGTKDPNAWGLHDMPGNVDEWCHDWYGTYPGHVTDPWGPATGSNRVVRGGSWNFFARNARAANRHSHVPGSRHGDLGFRPARSTP